MMMMMILLKSFLFPAVLTGPASNPREYLISYQMKTAERGNRLDRINRRLGNVVNSLKDNGTKEK